MNQAAPTETVVTARNHDGSIKSWRIAKPIDEIEEQIYYV